MYLWLEFAIFSSNRFERNSDRVIEASSLVVNAKECRKKLRSFQFQNARKYSSGSKQATESLHSPAVEPTDPMWSQNKTTEALISVAVDPMWSQSKTAESLRSVAVERTTERRYTANEALHNRSTNSEFVEKYGKYSNDDVVSVRKSRESRQAAKYSRKREREPSRIGCD